MIPNAELEKIQKPPLMRKKFRTDEVYQIMKSGILPEESGWELIDGEIIHRTKIKSKEAGAVRKLNKLLSVLFGSDSIISIHNPIHIDEHNEPEPDIALLTPHDDFYAEKHPESHEVLLVIEVSDSTLEFDREIKKAIYAEAGIKEFWLINLKQETVETYSDPANGVYYQMRMFGRGETINSRNIEKLSVETNMILGEQSAESSLEN